MYYKGGVTGRENATGQGMYGARSDGNAIFLRWVTHISEINKRPLSGVIKIAETIMSDAFFGISNYHSQESNAQLDTRSRARTQFVRYNLFFFGF